MAREDFVGVVRNSMAGLGFDQDASMVIFPIAPFLVDSDISPVERDVHKVAEGLTDWKPANSETGIQYPPRVRIEANGYEAAYDKMNRHFITSTWGDGLPLNPPTEERVSWILQGTNRDRKSVIGKVMPRGGIATVETLAATLAMSGGRPEYLPVMIAAVECILDPAMEHDKFQATSGSTYPVVIVNGPVHNHHRIGAARCRLELVVFHRRIKNTFDRRDHYRQVFRSSAGHGKRCRQRFNRGNPTARHDLADHRFAIPVGSLKYPGYPLLGRRIQRQSIAPGTGNEMAIHLVIGL